MPQIKKRALISVSDKDQLDKLVIALIEKNYEIISTGGTKKYINDLGFDVTPVSSLTGDKEILGGRVKTLSYKMYASLLFDRNNPNHLEDIEKLGILPIDLVVCNLYPFEVVAKKTDNLKELIENIDIGGPTMLRAAAKNYQHITTLSDPSDYAGFISHLKTDIPESFRLAQAVKTFARLEEYNKHIAFKLDTVAKTKEVYSELRYGENSHQKAWIKKNQYTSDMQQLHGKELSYNNMLDVEAAYLTCYEASKALKHKFNCVSVIKHNNPCGLAADKSPLTALINAWEGDNKSAFGSIICTNREVTLEMAHFFDDKFIEVLMAPSFDHDALIHLQKKKNLRLLKIKPIREENFIEYRSNYFGDLIQERDQHLDYEFQNVTKTTFNTEDTELMQFGIACGKSLKSNAICFVAQKDQGFWLAGAGMGQPNRIDSLELLAHKRLIENGESVENALMISDAFFPFRDTIDLSHSLGVRKIIQPGGSIKDQEVIKACDEHGIAMAFTHYRHFKH